MIAKDAYLCVTRLLSTSCLLKRRVYFFHVFNPVTNISKYCYIRISASLCGGEKDNPICEIGADKFIRGNDADSGFQHF